MSDEAMHRGRPGCWSLSFQTQSASCRRCAFSASCRQEFILKFHKERSMDEKKVNPRAAPHCLTRHDAITMARERMTEDFRIKDPMEAVLYVASQVLTGPALYNLVREAALQLDNGLKPVDPFGVMQAKHYAKFLKGEG